jgi:hypothetical protein
VNGFCVSNVCCSSACAGPCNATCQSGTCIPKSAHTSCGTAPGPGPGGASSDTDIALVCDGMGSCQAPTISCSISGGDVVQCDLNTHACCTLSPTLTGGSHQGACTTPDRCDPNPGDGDFFVGFSCGHGADCPLNQVCCNQLFLEGGRWAVCKAACDTAAGDSMLP